MRNFKKIAIGILSIIIGATSLVGCGSKDKIINDGSTVNIRLYKGGYGVEWIYELKDKFEQVYEEEGYKVNILNPTYDMKANVALQEMARGADKTGVDLYITGDITAEQLGVNGNYGVLAENIEESVYNQKPIGYDGKEEEKTIKDKIDPSFIKYFYDTEGELYMFPWVQSVGGLVVNTTKLAKYNLEIPKTTNELFDCFDKIYTGYNGIPNSRESNTYPLTFVQGASGYVNCIFNLWMAQYDYEGFEKYWSMQETVEGQLVDMIENGYTVFDTQSVKEMLIVATRVMDSIIATPGSVTATVDTAQANIMKDNGNNAVFMFNGDWMLNEVSLRYKDKLNDIAFVNAPVTSALGVKLFGDRADDVKCDEILSYAIKMVDEGKTAEEIVSVVAENKNFTITKEEATEIYKARKMYYSRSFNTGAVINKNAKNKKIAELFLRMMASEDFAETFLKYANGSTPYASSSDSAQYDFVKSSAELTTATDAKPVAGLATGLRYKLNLSNIFTSINHIPSYITEKGEDGSWSMYTLEGKKKEEEGDLVQKYYVKNAIAMWESEKKSISNETNWKKKLSMAGITI